MNFLVLFLGILCISIAVLLLIHPRLYLSLLNKYAETSAFQLATGLSGLILGSVLLTAASSSQHPVLLTVLGLFSLAGIGAACLPPADFRSLIVWELKVFSPFVRLGGVFAAMFGAFLIYTAT